MTAEPLPEGARRLVRHLVVAVVIKLLVLAGIWWWVVHETRVPVTPDSVARHIGGTAEHQKEEQ